MGTHNGFSFTLTIVFYMMNLTIMPALFIICLISLFLKNKGSNKYNKFNFILKIIFLLWSVMLYIVFFEITIDGLIGFLTRKIFSFEEKVLRLAEDGIYLILGFLPILCFLRSISKTIKYNKNDIKHSKLEWFFIIIFYIIFFLNYGIYFF